MALPTTLSSQTFPVSGSGNLGPFLYNGNVYVVLDDQSTLTVFKATDPTSSFSEQDATNAPNAGTYATAYTDAYLDGSTIRIMALESEGFVTAFYMEFDCSTDSWVDVVGDGNYKFEVYNPIDNPTTYWGGITARSDGDIIIVHPGENPSTMGGTYQQVAYSRMEYDGSTNWTDATNGIAFNTNYVVRQGGGTWTDLGFAIGDIVEITNAEDSGNNGRYEVLDFTTGYVIMIFTRNIATNNTEDTTAVVTKLYSTTTGVVVASTATKNDNYVYAKTVVGTNDQNFFWYGRDGASGEGYYLNSLSSSNTLHTQYNKASYSAATPYVIGGLTYTRSSTERFVFFEYGLTGTNNGYVQSYDVFTGDGSGANTHTITFASDLEAGNSFLFGCAVDTLAANNDLYYGYIDSSAADIFLRSDGGAHSTWTDQNGSSAIRSGTGAIAGISANIYTRGGNRVYAFLYDDAGTVKYDEFTLYAVSTGTGIVFTRRPVRFTLARF